MNKWRTAAILVIVFLLSFLILPDSAYNFEYDCSGVSPSFLARGGECGGSFKHDFTDLRILGGLHWLLSDDKAGPFIFVADYTHHSAIIPIFGAPLITAATALWLFLPRRKSPAKR